MSFAEKYVSSINSCNLMDDSRHHAAEALAAAALADIGDGLGSLLCRVKYADAQARKTFESGSANLAQLLRIWTAAVTEKGKARRWVRINSERDIQTAHILYDRVAKASLAYWLDGQCKSCSGTGIKALLGGGQCTACKGAGAEPITGAGGFELERIKDMVSEMTSLVASHASRATAMLSRADHKKL